MMRRLLSIALVGLTATGCYSVQPLATPAPAPGTRLAVSINDAGRAALGGAMGPEILRVDGSLVAKENDAYLLSVSGVSYLRGGFQSWQGERVTISSNMIASLAERRFSKARTAVLIAGATVAAVVLAPRALKSYLPDPPPPPTSVEASLRPRPGLQPLQIRWAPGGR
jgi:hypothetical protein